MKIGVMNHPAASLYDEIEAIGKARYDFIDLTIEGPCLDVDVQRAQELLDQHALFVVGHTDPCLPYAYPIKAVREACFKELERCAEIFSSLGATIMNIHPCYGAPPCMKHSLVEQNIEALKPIAEMAGGRGLCLVLENFKAPFDRVSTYEKMLSQVPELKVHLDVGHTNFGPDDEEVFCRRLGDHIKHVHFSDNRSVRDDHMPLGVGNVDWQRAVTSLKTIGYDGTVTLEVFCGHGAALFDYLEISRNLLLDLWHQ
ncbi:MAG: sugar phosphate isomerase/epimerase family protein [Thermodesulfobacteriota bacterium]|nr:sugar phosphate isomerase/epimerase family protein [Thermodesulfobacteriota bacterium]